MANDRKGSHGVARYGQVPGANAPVSLVFAMIGVGAALAVGSAWLALSDVAHRSTRAGPPASAPIVAAPAPVVIAPQPIRLPAEVTGADCPAAASVLFASGSAAASAQDVRAAAAALVAWLDQHPRAKIVIQGYADSVGADHVNLLLSYQRARALGAVLASAGVPEPRMSLSAVGSHELVEGVPGDARDNRRAIMRISDPDCRPDTQSP